MKKDSQTSFIPYGRQFVSDEDIAAVVEVLRSDWLTTGPKVEEFEEKVAQFSGACFGVAVCNGTAALHAAMFAIGVGPGDEVIVPAMTFAATANCVVYQGGTPVFADVDPETLLIDANCVKEKITSRTKAIIAVDYAGQPCDYDALRAIAEQHGITLVADGCHSLGGQYKGRSVGSLADLTIFSFHPVKHITTGEGGMIVTDNPQLAESLKRFRNHGISSDFRQREDQGTWYYEMVELGYNYRLTDLQSALGITQLAKLPAWLAQRRKLASFYDEALKEMPAARPLEVLPGNTHAYHLYVVRLAEKFDRKEVFLKMRQDGVGVNVHYLPVHLHPYYKEKYSTSQGMCPVAEKAYDRILSLPIHQGMDADDAQRVIDTFKKAVQ